MKKFFQFLKKNPLFVLLSLVSLALLMFEENSGSLLMAMDPPIKQKYFFMSGVLIGVFDGNSTSISLL